MNKKIFYLFLILLIFFSFSNKEVFAQNKINVVINEFIPDPEGADKENEWIEIRNLENREIDLNGWKLKDKSEKEYIIKEKISPLGYLVLNRQETKISINNENEVLFLLSPNNEISSKIEYLGSSKEGYSFSRKGKNDWQWTSITTPGKENVFPEDLDNKENENIENKEEIKENELNNELANIFNNEIFENENNLKVIGLAILIGIVFSFLSALFIRKYLK